MSANRFLFLKRQYWNVSFNSAKFHLNARCFTSSENNLRFTEKNGVRCITMCNKKTRNALSLSMLNDLHSNITNDGDNISLRSIVINADGYVFSCGHDLNELKKDSNELIHHEIFITMERLMNAIIESPVPVIAVVNGIATAAGCQLAAACDITICSDKSSFALPGANVGIFCSTPGIAVSRRVPKTVAAYMLFTGLPLTSDQALQSGLVCKVIPENQLEDEVKLITDAINGKSRSVIQIGKQFFYKQMEMDIKTAYSCGANTMVYNISLNDGQEGISSFLEKRKPNWSHKLDT